MEICQCGAALDTRMKRGMTVAEGGCNSVKPSSPPHREGADRGGGLLHMIEAANSVTVYF